MILVRGETTPEDIQGMEVAVGILTSRGGMTSHAAVVTRGMGKCCVAGAGDIQVDEGAGEMRVRGQVFKEGDWISLDGTSGRVIEGKLNTTHPSDPDDLAELRSCWAGRSRSARSACAQMPTSHATRFRLRLSAPKASACAAPSTCFFAPAIASTHMRAMILARQRKETGATRAEEAAAHQRADFIGLL